MGELQMVSMRLWEKDLRALDELIVHQKKKMGPGFKFLKINRTSIIRMLIHDEIERIERESKSVSKAVAKHERK